MALSMPRFRPKGRFEKTALADLWKHTLSQIPTLYGKLIYLAALRDLRSGTYRHYGLISAFGREDSVRALRESHEQIFQEWLRLPLEGQGEDIRQYLSALDEPYGAVLNHWLQSRVYRTYVPSAALEMERELFCHEQEALMETLKAGLVAAPPSSSPPA